MDSKGYLKSYGWQEGEALRNGGLKKPILVKHKKDKKGLGCAPGHDDSEAWWERLFDGQLRNLDIKSGSDGISFKQNEVVASSISKSDSPLYRSFVRGEVLKGTIETDLPSNNGSTIVDLTVSEVISKKDKKSKDEKKKKKKKKKKKSHKVDKPKSKHKKDKKDKKGTHKRKSSH